MKAIYNGQVLAESDTTEVVEGNHYFPPESLNKEYFEASDYTTRCPWKGLASYYTLNVGGNKGENLAWYYTHPSELALHIKDYVAFYPQVKISE